jgi:ketosteroid isomerase-like protein
MDGPLELLHRLLAQARAGQLQDGDDLLAPEVEWYGSVGGLEPGRAIGIDEVRRSFEEYRDSWDQMTFDDEAVIQAGDRALALVRERARGKGSGVEVEQGTAVLVTARDGRLVDIVSYLDLPQAYRDFGIDPAEAARAEPGRSYELRDGRIAEIGG